MVDGPQDMEGWGVCSIFKEAGRLLYHQIRILRPFILAFLLPLASTLLLEVIGIAWVLASIAWLAQLVQPDHLGGILGHYHHRHSGFHVLHAAFLKAQTPLQPNPYSVIIELILHTYTFTFLILFITWLLLSLATAAIAKAIHHTYSQNTSSSTTTSPNKGSSFSSFQTLTLILVHAIFTSLPNFFYRVFTISLCFLVVDIFTYLIVALPFYLFSGPQLCPYPLESVYMWFSYFLFLILDSWFEVSVQVAVLEVY